MSIDLDPDVSTYEIGEKNVLRELGGQQGKQEKAFMPVPDPALKHTKAKLALDRAIAIVKAVDLANGTGKIDDADGRRHVGWSQGLQI